MPLHWSIDHNLNIFVLGPMPNPKALDSSCAEIKHAVDHLLQESGATTLLQAQRTTAFSVNIPEELDGATISASVFEKIDSADLIIANLTPKDSLPEQFSPNVFYELGLVHALGIPCILLMQQGANVPFYFRNCRIHHVSDFSAPTVQHALREPLLKFLRNDLGTDFAANPITDFYRLPVVDISAAVGVATGYFENLVRRALLENGFIGRNDGKFRHLIVVRPPEIMTHTYEQDFVALTKLISRELDIEVKRGDLPMIEGYDKRGLSGHFVKDIMIDLPTAAYTLKRSPRQQALERRTLRGVRSHTDAQSARIMLQASERLLDQFQACVQYHVSQETGFRKTALSFCTFRDVVSRLKDLGVDS